MENAVQIYLLNVLFLFVSINLTMSEVKYMNLSNYSSKDVPHNPSQVDTLPFASQSFIKKNRDSSLSFNIQNQFQPANTITPSQELYSQPKIIKVAEFINNDISYDPQFIKMLQHYKTNPVVFVGVYGPEKAGKSFWLDKTLNLAKIDGNWYGNASQSNPCLKIFATPFHKKNLKMFFVDCTGFQNQQLTRQEEMRLDLMMSISSMIIVLPQPKDRKGQTIKTVHQHFLESQERLKLNGKSTSKHDNHWPHSCYCLYRSEETVKRQMQKLGSLFPDYNFAIIHDARTPEQFQNQLSQDQNQQFINELLKNQSIDNEAKIDHRYRRKLQLVFKDIYQKLRPKEYGNLKSYGKVMSVMFPQIRNGLLSEKPQFSNIITNTTKTLYGDNHKQMRDFLNQSVEKEFPDEEVQPVKANLRKFKGIRQKTLNQFDKETYIFDPSSPIHQDYENRLQYELQAQEKRRIMAQEKQTRIKLQKGLPIASSIKNDDEGKKYISELKKSHPEVDHDGRSKVVGQRLKNACESNMSTFFIMSQDDSKLEEIRKKMKERNLQFDMLEKKKRQKQGQLQEKQQLFKILFLKDSRLDDSIAMNKKYDGIKDDDDKLLELEKQKKSKFLDRLDRTKKQKQFIQDWLNDDTNISRQLVISKLISDIEQKKKKQTEQRNSILTNQLHSRIARISAKGSEIRKIDDNKAIKKSRIS